MALLSCIGIERCIPLFCFRKVRNFSMLAAISQPRSRYGQGKKPESSGPLQHQNRTAPTGPPFSHWSLANFRTICDHSRIHPQGELRLHEPNGQSLSPSVFHRSSTAPRLRAGWRLCILGDRHALITSTAG